MKYTLSSLMDDADKGGYAIPAFNYSDLWDLLAIVKAAEIMRAPVMLASNPLVVRQIGSSYCSAMAKAALANATVPIIHHLDHSPTLDMCVDCIDHGYPSVMIDASSLPLEENAAAVRPVVEYAHNRGVFVEGELGRIMGKNVEGVVVTENCPFLVDPEEAKWFVRETKVDSLAIGIGTAHGFYTSKPQIHFDILEKVNAAVDTKLVLHGGTGVPSEDIREAIRCGINKVNVGTQIHTTYMHGMLRELESNRESPYTLDIVRPVLDEITEVCCQWIKVMMADGKA